MSGIIHDLSIKGINGLMGLGPGSQSIFSQLASQAMTPGVFSHCLRGDAIGGGILVIGEILNNNMSYTPLVPNQ
jgi:hypothetical protein